MFSAFFIKRPVFAGVISIVIVIAGLVALGALPIARYPEIAPPTVEVTAIYPGADPETIAETVAAPIEREVNGVENMLYLSSVSSADGQMKLTVTFAVGTDLDMATVLVQNRVALAEPQLPEEVRRLGIETKKKSTEITLLVSLYSPDESLDELFLNNYTSLRVIDEVKRINGVGDVLQFGAEYGMRIWLDPTLLRARGLTVNDITAAIREQNVQVAAGQIGAEPAPPGQATQLTVNAKGRLQDPAEFREVVVRVGENGELTRLGDVARVELGPDNFTFLSRLNGSPASTFAVYQLPGANAIEVADGVRARLAELSEAFPPGLDFTVGYDATEVIRASIREVVVTLFVALALVIFTVYVFLQSFRATIIPAVTIPVSLIGTLAVMLAMGFSINLLTLFGLVLVIGIVVDDAIVVVENVTRHIDESGMSPKEAALKAMEEVSGPVIATTLVLLAVFVPTAFMPGIAGQLFRQFALTIAIATIFSSINALTLSPALAAILLRPSPTKVALPFRLFNRAFESSQKGVDGVVGGLLRRAAIGVVLYAALVTLAGLGFTRLPTGFVPQEDEGWSFVNLQLPDAASQQRTDVVARQLEQTFTEIDGVADVLTIVGYSLFDGAASPNTATFFVIFDSWDDRGAPSLSQDALLAALNGRLRVTQEAAGAAFVQPSLPGLGSSGGLAMQLQDRGGVGLGALQDMADEMVADGTAQSSLGAVISTFRANTPQLFVDIDREQVKSLGIPLQSVFDALQTQLGSTYVNDFTLFGRLYKVRTQAEGRFRADPSDIRALEVRTATGEMAPLGTMLSVEETVGPQLVTRHNVYPSIRLVARPAPGVSSGEGIGVLESMTGQKLPPSMGYEWIEVAFQQKQAGGALFIFALAIVFVYLVLAAQYESWTIPISVCLSVPTALLGAVGALMLLGQDVNLYTQIGIVLLIGLAAKSSILIVEFAKQLREEGKSPMEAAATATSLRFRAILMTAFSFILGVIPLVIATGAGAQSRRAIGATVFGGMIAATILSVLFVPVLYFVIEWLSGLGRRRATPAPEPAPEA
jgi:HAE1 family hydrophobic/amphiphilic exporter-1